MSQSTSVSKCQNIQRSLFMFTFDFDVCNERKIMSELETLIKREKEAENTSELETRIEWEENEVEMCDLHRPIKRELEEEEEIVSEFLTSTPSSKLCEATRNRPLNVLPAKSRLRYERFYRTFVKWCGKKSISDYTEEVLLEYFKELVSQNRRALWALYSMLRSCILIYKNVDISKYTKLLTYLKSQTANVQSKKCRALTEDQINYFIDQADDSEFLLMKVVLIIGVSGALHREELYNMTVKDLEFKADLIVISVPEAETNTCRRFVVINSKWVELIQKYLQIRQKVTKTKDCFFLKYHQGLCINSPIGINAIGGIPSKIAEYLHLEFCEEYTGHCFRRSSATLIVNRGNHLPTLRMRDDSKNNSDVTIADENCMGNPLEREIDVPHMKTTEPATSHKNCNPEAQHSNKTAESNNSFIASLFSRVQNCNIVVNVYNNCNVNK